MQPHGTLPTKYLEIKKKRSKKKKNVGKNDALSDFAKMMKKFPGYEKKEKTGLVARSLLFSTCPITFSGKII